MDSGVYIAVFWLSRVRRITVGRLGSWRFEPGCYLYVGTAQRGLAARLARHARRDKRPHWHIDYLSAQPQARMLGAITLPGPKHQECALARALAAHYPRPIPRFGASDCRCDGHLFYAGPWSEL